MRRAPPRPPFQQGKYDALCGFYAVLNAFRWLESLSSEPFDLPAEDQDFFNEAVSLLAEVRGAQLRLIRGDEGFTEPKLAALCRKVIAHYDAPLVVAVVSKMRPLPSSFLRLRRGAREVARRGPFALVASCDQGCHWTVYGEAGSQKVRIDSLAGYRSGPVDGRTTRYFDYEEGLILAYRGGA